MNLFELAAVLTLDRSGYDSGLNDAEKKAVSFGSSLKSGLATAAKVSAAAIGAASTAVVAFGKSSVDVGMTFDSSMSQVAATMGTTVDQIQNLSDYAQEMGSTTAFSASQAADAMNYMALAGYDAETTMEMLPNVLNLAAAGGIELAYASDMITDSQSALGLSLDETAQLVDKMAKASSKSNTSVQQLGEAILTVGGTAKTLSGGTTELSTALGILADNGVKGAEGGTALRNIILSLSAPTDTAAKAMESLGLNAFDADGNLRPLNETFSDLDAALSTMTQGEQTQVLNQIFNKVDLKSVNALLANTGERFDELSGYIDDASGSAQAMADTQLDNLAGDITLFQSALEGAQKAVSDKLKPTLRQFVQFGSDGISKLTEAFKEGGLTGAMDALGGVLDDGITMITDMLPDIVGAGVNLIDAFIDGITKNIKPLTDAAMKIAMKLIEGIGKTLPKLVTAGLDIIKALAQGVAENIETIVSTVVDVVLQIANALTNPETLTGLLDAGLQIIVGLANGLLAAVPTLIEALPQIITNIVTFFVESLPMIIETGVQLLTALVGALPDIITAIVEVLPQIIDGIIGALLDNIDMIIQAGVDLLTALVGALPDIITTIVEAIPQIIDGVITAIMDSIPQLIDAGIKLFTATIEALPDIIVAIVEAVPQIVDGIITAILDSLPLLIETGVQLFVALIGELPTIITTIVAAIPKIMEGIIKTFTGYGKSMMDVGKNIIGGVWEGIQSMAESLWNNVSNFFGGIVDGVKNMLGIHSPSTVFAEMGENMALGIGKGFDDEFSSIRDDMNDQMDFTANADVNVSRNGAVTGGYGTNAEITTAEKQPLTVIVQLSSGVELGRALIDNINQAKRVDGMVY